MIISMGRLVAAAAIFLVAVVGAGFVGRASAPGAGTTVPSAVASPSPSASAATLESFRAARNAICQRAGPSAQALNDAFSNPYDPGLTAAERSANADKLQAIIDFGDTLRAELAAVPVPPELAADQTAYLTRGEDLRVILAQEVLLLRAGKVSEAQQVDLLTDPINRQGEAFEQKYNLSPCP